MKKEQDAGHVIDIPLTPPHSKKKQRKKQTNKEGFKVLQYVAILYRGVDQGRVFMVCQVKG